MIRSLVLSLARGFVMGAADIVPGVSGGTIALMFGIYERLVASIKSGSSALGAILRADLSGFKQWMGRIDWLFILPLGVGILSAVVALSHIVEHLLETQAVLMAALFSGLVAGSIIIAWAMIRHRTGQHIWIAIGVAIVVFFALGLGGAGLGEGVSATTDPAMWAFFAAGAIAICAMILPGISGSFILVLLGMYAPLLSAVTNREFATLAIFILGTVVGLALFSQVLHRALTLYHDIVIAGLVGLMGGSLRVLWPWPDGVASTALDTPENDVVAAAFIFVAAFIVVIVIARFAQRLERADQSASTTA